METMEWKELRCWQDEAVVRQKMQRVRLRDEWY